MLPAQNIRVFLNNALRPTMMPAELEADNPLPEAIRDMPDQVVGRFVDLDPAKRQDIESALKRVVIFNDTQVLYTFTFDSQTNRFSARKR
jgi:hypothetical protein